MGQTGDPTRVLWLAKGLGPGGMERLLVTHAQVGDRDRFEYHAAYLVDRPHSVTAELEAAGVPCHRLGTGSSRDVLWTRELRALVRRIGADVVHVHSPMPAALARPALRTMRGRPAVVYTEHNSWDCYGRATRLANALTYPLDDAQLAVSDAAAASPPGPLGRRVETLVHGIDVDAVAKHGPEREAARAELGVADDTIVVVNVANLRREKAHDNLLAAVALAVPRAPELVVLCVGQGPLADTLAAERDRLGLGDHVRFLGFRDDVHRLLAAADVFCLASHHEGLPVALMEASAAGLPTVATAVGGVPSVVDDGRNGLLVPPGDAPALADALVRVAHEPDLRERLAGGALATAARFDATAAVARIESVYASVAR